MLPLFHSLLSLPPLGDHGDQNYLRNRGDDKEGLNQEHTLPQQRAESSEYAVALGGAPYANRRQWQEQECSDARTEAQRGPDQEREEPVTEDQRAIGPGKGAIYQQCEGQQCREQHHPFDQSERRRGFRRFRFGNPGDNGGRDQHYSQPIGHPPHQPCAPKRRPKGESRHRRTQQGRSAVAQHDHAAQSERFFQAGEGDVRTQKVGDDPRAGGRLDGVGQRKAEAHRQRVAAGQVAGGIGDEDHEEEPCPPASLVQKQHCQRQPACRPDRGQAFRPDDEQEADLNGEPIGGGDERQPRCLRPKSGDIGPSPCVGYLTWGHRRTLLQLAPIHNFKPPASLYHSFFRSRHCWLKVWAAKAGKSR